MTDGAIGFGRKIIGRMNGNKGTNDDNADNDSTRSHITVPNQRQKASGRLDPDGRLLLLLVGVNRVANTNEPTHHHPINQSLKQASQPAGTYNTSIDVLEKQKRNKHHDGPMDG